MQDYAEAVQAATDLYALVASSYYPNRRTTMGPKLTIEDLANIASDAYQAAPQQGQRWQAVARAIVERLNSHHFDVGSVDVNVGPRDTLIWVDEKTGTIELATGTKHG